MVFKPGGGGRPAPLLASLLARLSRRLGKEWHGRNQVCEDDRSGHLYQRSQILTHHVPPHAGIRASKCESNQRCA